MQNSRFPTFQIQKQPHSQRLIISVISSSPLDLQSLPSQIRQEFKQKSSASDFHSKVHHLFLSVKKAMKFQIQQDCFVSFSQAIQQMPNFEGIASTILSSAYNFSRKSKPIQLPKVSISADTSQIESILSLVEGKLQSKEWANGRGDLEGVPKYFISESRRIAKQHQLEITVFEGEELIQEGFRLLHAVGRASKNKPAFVNIKYQGNIESDEWIAFVGKGVCLDAGGLGIKSAAAMKIMFLDKQGACSVLSAFEQVVKEKLKVNLTVSFGLVQNFIGSNSYRPSDIIKSRKGLTVEIVDTDCEGRLILADCMNWTQEKYKVHTIIELSTLTYIVIEALGHTYAGLYTNSQPLASTLISIGNQVEEKLWQLPLDQEHHELLESQTADLLNDHPSNIPGATVAAAFLQCFVEKGVRWAHVDIAGTGIVNGEGTGSGVRLLLQFARNYQNV